MRNRSPFYVGVILLFTGLILKILYLARGVPFLVQYMEDDAFFYLTIARNIAHGNGIILNQGIPTDAFQPLYLVLLIPIFLIELGTKAPVYIVYIFGSILSISTAYMLYKIGCELGGNYTGLIAGGMWLVNPYIILFYMKGMETPLQVFFISILTYYLIVKEERDAFSLKHAVFIGVLLGLIFLSRLDGALIAIGFSIALVLRKIKTPPRFKLSNYSDIIVISITSLLIASPWFFRQIFFMNRLTPSSGEATRIIGKHEPITHVVSAYVRSIANTLILPWGAQKFEMLFNITSFYEISVIVTGFLLVIFAVYTYINHTTQFRSLALSLDFIIISLALHIIYYTAIHQNIRDYYLLFVSFCLILFTTLGLNLSLKEIKTYKTKQILKYITVSVLVIGISLNMAFFIMHPEPTIENSQSIEQMEVAGLLESNINGKKGIVGANPRSQPNPDLTGTAQYFTYDHDILIVHMMANLEYLRYTKTYASKYGLRITPELRDTTYYKYIWCKRIEYLYTGNLDRHQSILNQTFGRDGWHIYRDIGNNQSDNNRIVVKIEYDNTESYYCGSVQRYPN